MSKKKKRKRSLNLRRVKRRLGEARAKVYRDIVAESIGRNLLPGENVHHIDCDSTNNHISNLYLFKNTYQHREAHVGLNAIVTRLIRDGFIIFNKETGLYEVEGDRPYESWGDPGESFP